MSEFYVVATPIGNLGDITIRAVKILRAADFVLAEDTRQTRKLFDRFGIKTKLISFHAHSSEKKLEEIAALVKNCRSSALVSDAGTPLISDPGRNLIEKLISNGVKIIPLPGVSAVTSILSVTDFPVDRFTFYGFIPRKKRKSQVLQEIAASKFAVVFFESPFRILKTLEQFQEFADAERKVVVGREMTKMFEEFLRGSVAEVLTSLKSRPKIKGEITVVVSPQAK